jgi:transcriptional regulator with XRE-family HTH domain
MVEFGAFIRKEREARDISLRKMAKKIGVSATYLSQVELDRFPPPTEDRVKAIAKIIDCNPDYLLAKAGRISTDISDIIKRRPIELSMLIRAAKYLSNDDIAQLINAASA